jgi:hypothetical protein
MAKRVDVYLMEVDRSVREGNLRRGLAWLHAALNQDPGNPRLTMRVGVLLGQLGQAERSADWFQHAARQSEDRGLRASAHALFVRACASHPSAVEGAVACAHAAWERGETGEAAALLRQIAGASRLGGAAATWCWLTVAMPVARQAHSIPMALEVVPAMAGLLGVELVCFRLLSAGGIPEDGTGPLQRLARRFVTLEEDSPALLGLQGDLAVAFLDRARDLLEEPYSVRAYPAGFPSPLELAGGVTEPRTRTASTSRPWPPRPTPDTDAPLSSLRSHRPRPWQIPASIEAQRLPVQPVLPRELFARLPEPMRRSVVWLEAQQRRAAAERRRATP